MTQQVIDKPSNIREPLPPERWFKSARSERAAPAAAQPTPEPEPVEPVATYQEPDRRIVVQVSAISPQGYPVVIPMTVRNLDHLSHALDRLLTSGYTVPDQAPAPAAAPASAQAATPVCSIHNRPMKPMQRPTAKHTHMCTAKVGEGWCDQKA